MKKIFLTIAIIITIGFSAGAQTDGFFSEDGGGSRAASTTMPINPSGTVGQINTPQNASDSPLGEGLLVLTVLGVGYAMRRVKSRE